MYTYVKCAKNAVVYELIQGAPLADPSLRRKFVPAVIMFMIGYIVSACRAAGDVCSSAGEIVWCPVKGVLSALESRPARR